MRHTLMAEIFAQMLSKKSIYKTELLKYYYYYFVLSRNDPYLFSENISNLFIYFIFFTENETKYWLSKWFSS